MKSRRPRPSKVVARTGEATAEGFLQLGCRARFEGDLGGSGLVLIHGVLRGGIDLDGDLIVARDGRLSDARGRAVRLRVEGHAAGVLSVTEAVEVSSTGVLEGEVASSQLQASAGATIDARLRIGLPRGEGRE
ncbi:MAG: polymer-forming cytoskeletal protein [Acidobacteriota bacterium]|nr:polymer-forming cytoskeletal protein [Acidobacteriota bacterium]